MTLSESRDLRGGQPVWTQDSENLPPSDPLPERCDVAIIGAGIMGATIAERLSADGHNVALIDRRPPASGSTAASTAEVMWAMDVPLSKLAQSRGESEAAHVWRRVNCAVSRYLDRIHSLGIRCGALARPTLYLAGSSLDESGLKAEAAMHGKAGLPTSYLSAGETAERFGVARRAALVSTGGFEVDPVALTLGLIETARSRGASVSFPEDVVSITHDAGNTVLKLDDGKRINAARVVFAGGYERAPLLLPQPFGLLSTFVIATAPGVAPLWREGAMIWEASDPYLYVRSCATGRIIAGGEDETVIDPASRDAMLPGKAAMIAHKTAAILGMNEPLQYGHSWAATFGSSPDGLPAIGPAANSDNVWITAGFGGNGIAFAALASEILSADLNGTSDADTRFFAPGRFSQSAQPMR